MNKFSLGLGVFVFLGVGVFGQHAPDLAADSLPAVLPIELPDFFTERRPISANRPLDADVVQLGRRLFFDPILSKDKSVACASCHRPMKGFASAEILAVGIGGKMGTRNTPSIFNRGFGGRSFWDGRAATLEEQVLEPISNPLELGHTLPGALAALKATPDYEGLFRKARKTGIESQASAISKENLAHALASFLRTLVLGDSPVDRFHGGDSSALTTLERRGLWVFESRGGCWQCHTGFKFSDESFHNTGISFSQEPMDPGRGEITHDKSQLRAFKTPSLRGLTKTAPYMHDGSKKTLLEVVEFYNQGGNKNDPLLDRRIRPLQLDEGDVKALVALLKALSLNNVDSSRGGRSGPQRRDKLSEANGKN